MVQLRALQGDTSDNIPGVPRVPNKVLLSLLKTFRTIEGIYDSSLPGLTKLQYEKIRAAEKQVKLNVSLMQLRDIDYTVVEAAPDQEKFTKALEDIEVQVEPFLVPFFTPVKGFSKTG
jgi:DNA polymerase-1